MAAPTYTFSADFTTTRDQVRQLIGDVETTTDPILSDEAIAWFYTRAGSDLTKAALLAARAAAAKLSREYDKDLDGLSTKRSQRHKAMLDTIAQLEAEIAATNYTSTTPEIGTVEDEGNYPVGLEMSDEAVGGW